MNAISSATAIQTSKQAAPAATTDALPQDTFTQSNGDNTGIYSPKIVTLNGPVHVPGKFQPRIVTQDGPVHVPGRFQPAIVTLDGPIHVDGEFQPR